MFNNIEIKLDVCGKSTYKESTLILSYKKAGHQVVCNDTTSSAGKILKNMKTYLPTPAKSFSGLLGHPFKISTGRCLFTLVMGLLAAGGANAVGASFITGDIQFNGGATLNTGDLATATAFTSIFGPGGPSTMPQVLGGGTQTGDYATVPDGTLVSFSTFTFAVNAPVTPLWAFTVGATSYSFDATSVTVAYQSSYFLDIVGTGVAHITGFNDTSGVWEVTDTGAGGTPVFTFGAATDLSGNPMPEPSTTALLLVFLPVAWVAFRARRNSQNRSHTPTK
ncbi:MAG TPA: hypothetical protein VN048_19835 [Verrucomicrobiae bacterium]|nr:hypothetical protein [Verrucomicrobiae bacterium]